tara:strand:+ start:322 stop:492 length:171 start_codon:yes stop_codon:yes gene_type:complete
MAIMSRAKKAKGRGWAQTNEARADANKPKEIEKKEITEEEHQEKIDMLKKLGLIED